MRSNRGMAKKIWISLIITAMAAFCLFSIAGLAAVPEEEVKVGYRRGEVFCSGL